MEISNIVVTTIGRDFPPSLFPVLVRIPTLRGGCAGWKLALLRGSPEGRRFAFTASASHATAVPCSLFPVPCSLLTTKLQSFPMFP